MAAPEETWVDVTSALRSGVMKLSMGETLCAQGFELEQAISAAEIGDPRMDPPLDPDMHVDVLVAKGKMAVDLSLEQQAALLDALTIRMVQWWTGSPLHLTLYTSLHLAAREQVPLECQTLRASVDVVQSLVDITRHISHHSGVVVDEDIPLATPILDDQMVERAGAPQIPTYQKAIEDLDSMKSPSAEAVKSRLQLLHSILMALKHLDQASRAGIDKAKNKLQIATASLKAVADTAELVAGEAAPAMYPDLYRMHLCCPTCSVNSLAIADAHSTISTMIECLTEMCALRGLEDFASVIRLAGHISVTWDSALCRGVLHNLLQPPGVELDEELPDWAPTTRKFQQQLHLPLARTQVPYFSLFLDQMKIAVGNYIQAICSNRARVRRRLRNNFQDWSRMHAHAENADHCEEMRSFLLSKKSGWTFHPEQQYVGPCSLWVEHLTSLGMLEFLLLGFELGLYVWSEYKVVFCYCMKVLELQQSSLQRLCSARPKEFMPLQKKNKQKSSSNAQPEMTNAEHRRVAVERHYLAVIDTRRLLCSSYVQLCIALEKAGIIAVQKGMFGTEEHRYAQRYECFKVFPQAVHIPFKVMKQHLDSGSMEIEDILDMARTGFKQVEERIENMLRMAQKFEFPLQHWELEEWRLTGQVAKTNWTACSLLKLSILQVHTFIGCWELTVHKKLPCLRLKRRQS